MEELSAEDVKRWRDTPRAVTKEEHEAWCISGGIIYDQQWRSCPVCALHAHEARLLKRIAEVLPERYVATEWADLELLPPLDRLSRLDARAVVREGSCALFYGPPGSGKTQSAALLCKGAIRAGFTAALANIGMVCVQIRAGYNGEGTVSELEAIQHLSGVDLLALDDLGAGESAGGALESRLLFLILERRQNANKPTVVTSNLKPDELASLVGQRTLNRLVPFDLIAFDHGRNFRRSAQKTVWGRADD